jgi:hypothetical protein
MPTLLPTPGGFTEPGQTAHLGQVECAEIVGPDGFVDRPCTVATDYDAVMDTMEVVYHNELHRFIGGGFGPPAATSGTMVFWAFHTQVSTNMLSNLRHTQKRDMGVPVATCNGQTYEAEDIFKSTGGPATDGWNIWDNGFISTDHTFAPGYTEINVVARGDAAFGVWPHMVVTVDGEVVGDVNVTTAGWSTYTFAFNATAGNQQIRVAFDNDVYAPPFADRNLIVDALYIDCVEPPPPAGDPCASFCAGPDEITWEGSYQSGDLGTGTTCRQTTQEAVGINCSNFTGGKQLSINGVPMTCNNQNQLLPTPVDGGYCIQSTAGDYSWASYALW